MCLITNQSHPYIAKRDFTVCKVLISDCHGNLLTPYQLCPIEKVPMIICGEGKVSLNYRKHSTENLISKGYIHSYINFIEAIRIARASSSYGCKGYLLEAIIPKGAQYFVGNDGDACSDKLFLKHIERSYDYRGTENIINSTGLSSRVSSEHDLNDYLLEQSLEQKEKNFIELIKDNSGMSIEEGCDLIITTLMINGIKYDNVPLRYI